VLLIDWSSNCGGIRTVNHLDINSRWCLLNMHDAHLVLFAVHVADSHDMWSLIKFVCIYTKKSFVLTFVPDFINSLTQQYLDTEMGGGGWQHHLAHHGLEFLHYRNTLTYLLTYQELQSQTVSVRIVVIPWPRIHCTLDCALHVAFCGFLRKLPSCQQVQLHRHVIVASFLSSNHCLKSA